MHPVAIHLLAFARHGHPRARPGTAGGFRRRNEARSVAQKALLRTISSRGTGPSRHERPTLAFKSEGGGAVHDGPLAKDAGILPGGWEQGYCRCSRRQANATGGSAVGSAGGRGVHEQPRGSPRILAAQGGRERVSSRVRWATVWRSCALDASTRTVSM